MLTTLREFILLLPGRTADLNLILLPSGVLSETARCAQSMCPPCIDIQSIPRITSKPCDSNTTRCALKLCAPILTVKSRHPALAIISPPGELNLIDSFIDSVGNLYLSTNALDMNECNAPISKSISAGLVLIGNLPI